jgi:hypothetical protein
MGCIPHEIVEDCTFGLKEHVCDRFGSTFSKIG